MTKEAGRSGRKDSTPVVSFLRRPGVKREFGLPAGTSRLVGDDLIINLGSSVRKALEEHNNLSIRVPMPEGHEPEVDQPRSFNGGDFVVHVGQRLVTVGGEDIDLVRKEFDVLEYLSARPGIAISRDLLLEDVWGRNYTYIESYMRPTVTEHVRRLRINIGDPADDGIISTVRGVGYRFTGMPDVV